MYEVYVLKQIKMGLRKDVIMYGTQLATQWKKHHHMKTVLKQGNSQETQNRLMRASLERRTYLVKFIN